MKTTARNEYRPSNSKLLVSCATLAIAAVTLNPQKARAQAFNGTIASSTNASQTSVGTGTETITVTNSAATINWNATDNNFLPSGNTATFTSNAGITDYTVLNRITPVDGGQIQLNGNLVSYVNGVTSGTSNGGNIWFYAPGGILVGSGAVFDVGGLLLTSINPTLNSNNSSGFSAGFSRDGDGGTVEIDSGALITALQQNSYIALVAPRVVQGGSVRVSGSAAYVAGDAVTMTMDQGLFDIQIDTGTDDPNGIVHTGSTTGPDMTGDHRIYMMAVPKNQAMQMLIGGTIGYDATSAAESNGYIYLNAGATRQDDIPDSDNGTGLTIQDSDSSILIDNANFTSFTSALAMRDVDVQTLTGDVTFLSDVVLQSVYGDVSMKADEGKVSIGGAALLYASPFDFFFDGEGDSQTRTGGDVTVSAVNGGSIEAGRLELNAVGKGEDNAGGGSGFGGDGYGGSINVDAQTDGTITVHGDISADASGVGGKMFDGSTQGGLGRGGSVIVQSSGGSIEVGGNVTLTANGTGGSYVGEGTPFTALGGEGDGGYAQLFSGAGSVKIDGVTVTNANGTGGDGQTGGFGKGGHSGVSSTGGSVILGSNADVAAEGHGGSATYGVGGSGGAGEGGVAYIEADSSEGGSAGSITGAGATISSNATGGTGGAGNSDVGPGSGGSATGGQYEGFDTGGSYALADINSAILALTNVTLTSSATGGVGGTGGAGQVGGLGGDALGGYVQAGTWNPTQTTDATGSAQFGDLNGAADGIGGAGGLGDNGGGNADNGGGGNGTGGGAAFGGTDTSVNDLTLSADGTGGTGGNGGQGDGGNGETGGVLLNVPDNGAVTVTGDIILRAVGTGGDALAGVGGTGIGGDVGLNVGLGGTLNGGIDGDAVLATGDISIFNKGQGGKGGDGSNGGSGGSGGQGYGGTTVQTIDGSVVAGDILVRTLGVGADGGNGDGVEGSGGSGGYGRGGTNTMTVGEAGSIDAATYTGYTNGIGGNGGSGDYADGNGGDGHGGTNAVTIDGDVAVVGCDACGPFDSTLGFVVTAYGQGGSGLNGGYADGGNSSITVNGSLSSDFHVQASGQAGGGNGVDYGGGADGGSASILVNGSLSAGTIFVGANAGGGDGSTGGVSLPGGGTAYAGTATLSVTGSIHVDDSVLIQANANGGNSASGIGGDAYARRACECEGGPFGAVFTATNGGTATIGGDLNIESQAWGGSGLDGGYAEGGYAELSAFGPSSITADGVTGIHTDGSGGNGDLDRTGGTAFGGDSWLLVGGGSVNIANTVMSARGTGGSGGTGGEGHGGTVTVTMGSAGGSLTLAGETLLTSNGFGGDGLDNAEGTGGAGGAAWGGVTQLTTENTLLEGATAELDLGDAISLRANAGGGAGGDGLIGGAGGMASGNQALINLGTVSATAGEIVNSTYTGGGAGGTGSSGAGGDGGYASGGYTDFTLGSGGSIEASSYIGTAGAEAGGAGNGTTTAGNGGAADGGTSNATIDGLASFGESATDLDGFIVTAFAQGGSGATGGSAGGGTSSITVNGSLDVTGLIQSTGQAQGGAGGDYGGDATGGTASVIVNNELSAGRMFVAAGATGGNGDIARGSAEGGTASLEVNEASATIANDATILADADGAGATAGFASVNSYNGGDLAVGDLTLSAEGDLGTGSVQIAAGGCDCGPGTIEATDLTLIVSDDLDVPLIGDAITVSGKVDLHSGGDINMADVTAGRLKFDAEGSVTGGDINVTERVDGGAKGAIVLGDIVAGLPDSADGLSVGLESLTSISVGDVTADGNVGFATYGNLTTGDISSGGDLVIAMVGGDISTGSIGTANDGDVYLADISMFITGGGDVGNCDQCDFDPSIVLALPPVATGGSITINGPVTTGRFRAAAGSNLTVNDITASDSVDLSAGDLASFYGTVSAPDITVTSSDIDVGEGAQLGVWGVTDNLTFNADSRYVLIGSFEGETPGGYRFDEAGDIAGTNVTFNALGGDCECTPDFLIGNVHIDGSGGEFSAVSHVTLNTHGSIYIDGLVDFADAGATDSLALNAGNSIQVDTDFGGIRIADNQENLAGTLELTAHDIWVADGSVLGQLSEDSNPGNLAQLLANNSGEDNQGGYLQAGAITATMLGSSFLVQNSGTADHLAGLTVGNGGLSIVNNGEDNATVIVNGRQVKSNGSVVSGDQFAESVDTSGTFTNSSTINGCPIAACAPPPPPPPDVPPQLSGAESILGPIGEMDSPLDLGSGDQGDDQSDEDDGGDDQSSVDVTLGLINTGPVNLDQPVDDPITSGGDGGFTDGPSGF